MRPLTDRYDLTAEHLPAGGALAPARDARVSAGDERTADLPTGSARLAGLLDRAARVGPDDPAWTGLRAEATELTAFLVQRQLLPRHLVVAPDDPTVVVARTLAAATGHLGRRHR
jgi:hypothetical protein